MTRDYAACLLTTTLAALYASAKEDSYQAEAKLLVEGSNQVSEIVGLKIATATTLKNLSARQAAPPMEAIGLKHLPHRQPATALGPPGLRQVGAIQTDSISMQPQRPSPQKKT